MIHRVHLKEHALALVSIYSMLYKLMYVCIFIDCNAVTKNHTIPNKKENKSKKNDVCIKNNVHYR